ncbi:MAG TPA: hypothetical protein VK700_13380 [Steroidobacteraceae bacterium]|jgi:uncharacterized membrane protein|nr:hypothetical protein [Steroidobacteraceae bacterium]
MDQQSEQALEQRVTQALAGTAQFKAPHTLEAQVLEGIERRARVPWWQRRVPEWPLLAQLLFGVTGIATAAALLLLRPATPRALGTAIGHPAAVLQRPAADLHATLNLLAVLHRLLDTMAGTLPDGVWYGGLALCAAAYIALFCLIAFCYRLVQTPASR